MGIWILPIIAAIIFAKAAVEDSVGLSLIALAIMFIFSILGIWQMAADATLIIK